VKLPITIAIILIVAGLELEFPKRTSGSRYAPEMAATKAITTIHTAET
jgi:hypothetical protein